jgi:hypothetical protein
MRTELLVGTGVAQNWRSSSNHYTYTLPFAFPFYGESYTTAYVSTEGFLQFGTTTSANDSSNTASEFLAFKRIAPMWDNLSTNSAGKDIYVDESVADQVTIRWDATNEVGSQSAVNFAVVLFATGEIEFHYGDGNTGLSPTIGLSAGNGADISLAPYDGAAVLTNASPIRFNLSPGFVDIGAYEFRGQSDDSISATVIGGGEDETANVHNGGILLPFDRIGVTFSEEMNNIDAASLAGYELRSTGVNGVFDDGDDQVILLTPEFDLGDASVTLIVADGIVPVGHYRLTIFNEAGRSQHDTAGLQLDGNSNGDPGGNYVRLFEVAELPETLLLVIDVTSMSENSGTATGTVTRSNTDDLSQALTVELFSDDASEATVPATIEIPANQASATFTITAVDDVLLDGTQTVTVTATHVDYVVGGSETLDVTDYETLSLVIDVTSISENGGAGTGTVTRSNTDDLSQALIVDLSSDDTSEATVPSTVEIPANQASATFTIAAVDDALLDGTQTVTITATHVDYAMSGSQTLDVTDHEPADLTGNGIVDFQDLTRLLAHWGQNASEAEGNLVDPDGSVVNFQDLTRLLASWTVAEEAASPQAAAVSSDPIQQDSIGPVAASTIEPAGDVYFDRLGRREARRDRTPSPLRRLQAAAVDRAIVEDSIEDRELLNGRRPRRTRRE